MEEKPLQRTLKVGKVSIGLVGLDLALQKALQNNLDPEAATAYLFGEIARQNYVPAQAEPLYREALEREYRRLRGEQVPGGRNLTIRILGPGCVSCNRLNTLVYDILQQLEIAADIEQVHDLDEIWRYGVLSTPALVINDEVKCAGRLPTPAQVEEWLKDAAA